MKARDFEKTAVEILRSMRGRQSQQALSRKLGYSFNQVYRWEASRRKINWLEFLNVARVQRRPIERAVKLGLVMDFRSDRYDLLVKSLVGSEAIKNVAGRLGVGADQVSRWTRRKSIPSLAQMLELISLRSDRLIPFLNYLVNVSELSAFKREYERDAAICFLKAEYPELTLVLYVFSLSVYRSLSEHSDKWIATRLGIDEKKVALICEMVAHLGIIKKENGLWVLQSQDDMPEISSAYNTLEQRLKLKAVLLDMHRKALSMPEAFERRDLFKLRASHLLFTINQHDYLEISRLSDVYYNDVLEVVRRSEASGVPHDCIVAMNLHFLDILAFNTFKDGEV